MMTAACVIAVYINRLILHGLPPPAAAKPPARKLDVQLSTRSTALANALDDESTKGMSAVQRRIKAIEDKMKGKK